MSSSGSNDRGTVWEGRPAVGVYVALYGIIALIAIAILVGLEFYIAAAAGSISSIFYSSLKLGPLDIPDALEVVTGLIVVVAYLVKVVALIITRAENSYELRSDGLYVNKGIANLQNTFISAMAFSDARLIRTVGMRVVGRGMIVVEANDGRRFELKMLKDSQKVQSLIRSNLSHPTVRVEK